MIDLSFLSEEEQETILAVLRRDAQLKKAEEHRVRNLQKTVSDRCQLRYMTGEWFYETKQLRHQDRIHGSDIIRASMKQKHTQKPLTILELSQMLPEKSGFVSCENKEVFVPSVLCGILQEPQTQLSNKTYQNQNLETPQDTPKPVLLSPTKQRKNPFNTEITASHSIEGQDNQLLDRPAAQTQTPYEDVFEPCQLEFLRLISAEQESGPPVHYTQANAIDGPTGHIHHQKLPEQSIDTSVKATSDTKLSTNGSSESSSCAFAAKPRRGKLGFSRNENNEPVEVQSTQKEDVRLSKPKEPGNTQNFCQGPANTTVYKPTSVKQEVKTYEVRTLPLTALQNTPFKETMTSVEAQHEATEGRVVQPPESNLNDFCKREKTGSKIIFTREEEGHTDIAKSELLHGPQTISDMVSIGNNISHQVEMAVEDTAFMSQERSLSPQTDCSLNLSKEDGTYRANPVILFDEMDDSPTGLVTESQISEPLHCVITPVLSSVAISTQKQRGDIPVSFPWQSTSCPQEDKPAKITELKHLWEKENTEIYRTQDNCNKHKAPINSIFSTNLFSPKSDMRTSSVGRDKFEGEAQTSPYKTKSNVLKSSKITDKGFVGQSSDRSQLRSSGSTIDMQSTWHQYQIKADTEAQERPLSPSKSQTSRSKDQDDEVRRSPSKTCHPRVLPRESSTPNRSRLERSPLKTFPINIDPHTKDAEAHPLKPTPAPRQRKSPTREAMQTVMTDGKPSKDIISSPPPLLQEDGATYSGYDNSSKPFTPTPSKQPSEKKLQSFKHLVRSFIPHDYQHYLGPQETCYVPTFEQEKAAAADNDSLHRPLKALEDFVQNQNDSPTEGNSPRGSSWIVQNKDGNFSHKATTTAWSLTWASSSSYDETSSPVMSALKRLSARSMSSSKSLENLTLQTISSPTSACTLSNSEQMKTSMSVPVLQQEETDSDSNFETSLGWRRNTGSSMSNISLSSGMVSMSSVNGSISSIYPADIGDIEVQGSIQFAGNYIQKLGEFHIFVVHCRDLAVAETKKNRSDPCVLVIRLYVKCYLLPDKTKLGKRKTTVKKKTLNPTYNEILRFKVIMEVLKTQNLNISVWHNDTFGRNSFLGEVDLDLSEWDFSNTEINEYALKARVTAQTSTLSPSHLMDSRGQMRVALRFLPQASHSKRPSRMETGEVQIWVKDCKNLPSVRGVIIDPFVKCTVLPDTSRKSRQKTRVVKRTANPMFNHTMVYDGFRPEDLKEACVEITVWDHDRLNNHYIGGLRLGLGTGKSYGAEVVWMDSTTDEAQLWQRMLQCDAEWVEDVLPLRMW
ncbi:synaptotagmin-like protein 2 isoform X3 [Acanthopagrus latus]|uniref:synaptotagmin-like protein 2 isoform X3 n=1 Tax=Acanthopagrus latus TaxID=8177 RepID=UPI00187CF76D|nr:synaptotagmin-like protein 2 isoform X3 [Acanthopagrus latus]